VLLVTSKTDRTMIFPMAPALRSHIESLQVSDNPQFPLHPRAFSILTTTNKIGTLSNAFTDLLVQAGLRAKPVYVNRRSRGIRHSRRRKINALCVMKR
jgi:hypothetical protein